jgi:Tol biopolymer transport system component
MRTRQLAAVIAAGFLLADPAVAQGPAPAATLPLKTARTHRFTTTTGTWLSLDVSPDGQTIVFDLLGDLYTLPIAGGTATRLTSGMAHDAMPRFSPDGRRVVFVSDRSGGDNVWILSLDGKDTVQVTKGNGAEYISPEWTPDGQYVVVSRSSGLFATAKLWMYHVDGGNGVPLGAAPRDVKQLGAAFGKDPRYVWYADRQGDWSYNAIGAQYQLGVYDRVTGKTARMSTRLGSAFRPALSADGRWLAFASRHETQTGLRLRNLDTQEERWLAYPVQRDDIESRAPLDAYPGYAFTPDSRAVVVTYGGEIWRVPVDSAAKPAKVPFTAAVELELGPEVKFAYRVDTAATLTAKQVRDLQPSPDGKRVAFSALDRVYVMDWPGGTPQRVSTARTGEFGPVWSPDGKSLAWTTWDDVRGGDIVRATWDDKRRQWGTQVLTQARGLYSDLAWSPAGNRLVASRAAARELQEAGAAFWGPAASDLVWIPATGGAATLIMPAGGLGNAHFTADSTRIYAYGGGDGLVSFRWDGTDLKTHLKVVGPIPPGAGAQRTVDGTMVASIGRNRLGGRAARPMVGDENHQGHLGDDHTEPSAPQPPPAALVLMAPKGDQALALVGMDVYAITVPQVGAAAPTVSVAAPGEAAVPVRKLNEIGGEFPAWSASGRAVHWSLGNAVWTYDLDRAKVVEDSLKAAAKAAGAPAAPADSAGRAAAARRDSLAKAAAYKPAEVRVAVSAARDIPRGVAVLRGGRAITMKGREIIEDADIVVRDNRIVAVGARGHPDGRARDRRARQDGHPRVRGHALPPAVAHAADPQHADLAVPRHAGLRHHHHPRPADRRHRLPHLRRPRGDGGHGRAAHLHHRPRRLLRRGHPRLGARGAGAQALQRLLPHRHPQDVHDRQPAAAAVGHHGGAAAGDHAHHRGGAGPQAGHHARHRRLPGDRAHAPHHPQVRRRLRVVQGHADAQLAHAHRGVRRPLRRELLVHQREPRWGRQAAALHAPGGLRRQDPPPRLGGRRQPGPRRVVPEGGVLLLPARAGRGQDRGQGRAHRRGEPRPAAGAGDALGDLDAAERRALHA